MKIKIEVYKGTNKNSITWTPKYNNNDKAQGVKAVNITGSIIAAYGIIASDNEDLSETVLGKRGTLAFDVNTAKDLLTEAEQVFKTRADAGDKNPVLNIEVEAARIVPLPNTYYVNGISDFKVIGNCNAALDSTVFKTLAIVNEKTEENNPRKNQFLANLITTLTTDVRRLGKKESTKKQTAK